MHHPIDMAAAGDFPAVGELVEQMTNLPSAPIILAQVLRVAESEEQSAESLAAALESDHALTTRLLRVANSAFYGMAQEIYTARDAIIMIGFEAVRSLAISAVAVRGVWVNDPLFKAEPFWGHSLTCGLFAEAVAKKLHYRKPEVAFTLGVIHDIGRVVLIQCLPDKCRAVAALAQEERLFSFNAERRIIGFDHAEVGARMAEKWNLPPAYSQAIRFHHEPERATSERDLTHLLALANAMSHHAFPDQDGTRYAQPLYRGLWEPLGLSDSDLRELMELQSSIGLHARVFYDTVSA